MERTLAIIKPDAVNKGVIGEILSIIEIHDFKIVNMKMTYLTKHNAEEIYAEHKGKEFFDGQIEFMTSGPVVMMILEKDDAVSSFRRLVTNIRKRYGTSVRHNAVHGSDSIESAKRELKINELLFYF